MQSIVHAKFLTRPSQIEQLLQLQLEAKANFIECFEGRSDFEESNTGYFDNKASPDEIRSFLHQVSAGLVSEVGPGGLTEAHLWFEDYLNVHVVRVSWEVKGMNPSLVAFLEYGTGSESAGYALAAEAKSDEERPQTVERRWECFANAFQDSVSFLTEGPRPALRNLIAVWDWPGGMERFVAEERVFADRAARK
jgi:hypothetical protein